MISYIQGKLAERKPTHAVIEANGVGYLLFISIYTYTQLPESGEVKLHTSLIIKEDGHHLYGFWTEEERALFNALISVSGVGPGTARLILSSLEPQSVKHAIIQGDDLSFKKVKGVGPKTAQRIIIDLKDKLSKEIGSEGTQLNISSSQAKPSSEAMAALLALGFSRPAIEQALKSAPKDLSLVEDLIKYSLKKLA